MMSSSGRSFSGCFYSKATTSLFTVKLGLSCCCCHSSLQSLLCIMDTTTTTTRDGVVVLVDWLVSLLCFVVLSFCLPFFFFFSQYLPTVFTTVSDDGK